MAITDFFKKNIQEKTKKLVEGTISFFDNSKENNRIQDLRWDLEELQKKVDNGELIYSYIIAEKIETIQNWLEKLRQTKDPIYDKYTVKLEKLLHDYVEFHLKYENSENILKEKDDTLKQIKKIIQEELNYDPDTKTTNLMEIFKNITSSDEDSKERNMSVLTNKKETLKIALDKVISELGKITNKNDAFLFDLKRYQEIIEKGIWDLDVSIKDINEKIIKENINTELKKIEVFEKNFNLEKLNTLTALNTSAIQLNNLYTKIKELGELSQDIRLSILDTGKKIDNVEKRLNNIKNKIKQKMEEIYDFNSKTDNFIDNLRQKINTNNENNLDIIKLQIEKNIQIQDDIQEKLKTKYIEEKNADKLRRLWNDFKSNTDWWKKKLGEQEKEYGERKSKLKIYSINFVELKKQEEKIGEDEIKYKDILSESEKMFSWLGFNMENKTYMEKNIYKEMSTLYKDMDVFIQQTKIKYNELLSKKVIEIEDVKNNKLFIENKYNEALNNKNTNINSLKNIIFLIENIKIKMEMVNKNNKIIKDVMIKIKNLKERLYKREVKLKIDQEIYQEFKTLSNSYETRINSIYNTIAVESEEKFNNQLELFK